MSPLYILTLWYSKQNENVFLFFLFLYIQHMKEMYYTRKKAISVRAQ